MSVSLALWIVFWDIIAWGFFHYVISDICFRVPLRYFRKKITWFQIAQWENSGFIWNPAWAGWIMIGYALVVNIPFIITQRYNRARIESILNRY